jgi:hypothetical protein
LFHFSITTLLIATTLVAVIIALPTRSALKQRHGRQWVAAQRGHVWFEPSDSAESSDMGSKLAQLLPDFIVSTLGIDFFKTVKGVMFDCDELVDVAPIQNLPSAQTAVVNIEIADQIDFTPLADLPELSSIHFTKWSFITEQQLYDLERLLPKVEIISETYLR